VAGHPSAAGGKLAADLRADQPDRSGRSEQYITAGLFEQHITAHPHPVGDNCVAVVVVAFQMRAAAAWR
jgi:hypothetical protein